MKNIYLKNSGFLLVLIFICFLSTAVTAQDKKLNFGAKAGLTFGNFEFNGQSQSQITNKGYTFGGYASYSVFEWLAAGAEINYMQTGAVGFSRTVTSTPSTTYSYKIRLDYLDIPIYAILKPNIESSIKPFVKFGPSFGFAMSMKAIETQTTTTSGSSTRSYRTTDIGSNFTSSDFALNFGTGFTFPTDKLVFGIEARLRKGLNNINTFNITQNPNLPLGGEITNTTFMITTSLGF